MIIALILLKVQLLQLILLLHQPSDRTNDNISSKLSNKKTKQIIYHEPKDQTTVILTTIFCIEYRL